MNSQEISLSSQLFRKEEQRQNLVLAFMPIFANIGIGIWGVAIFQHSPQLSTLVLLIVICGMIYENGVSILGYWMNPSFFLQSLNYLRHIFHNLCIPLLIVVCLKFLDHTDVNWAHSQLTYRLSLGLTLSLILLGLRGCLNLELIPEKTGDVVQYTPKTRFLPISTILTSLIMAGAGIYIWTTLQWPWVLIGTFIMIAGNANADRIPKWRCHLCAGVEIVFMISLFATASHYL